MESLITPSDATDATVNQATEVAKSTKTGPSTTTTPPVRPGTLPSSQIDLKLEYDIRQTTDFLFQIHALNGMDQQVLSESLELDPPIPPHIYEDPNVHHRFMRLQAPKGKFKLRYRADVRRTPAKADTNAPEIPIAELPDSLLHNLMPTRYCESDHLGRAAFNMFCKQEPGYARVQAITDWIHDNIDYQVGSTDSMTTARDVFVNRAGVCRDFAHLGVTFCRALSIPARLVVGYAKFDSPPNDFHAVFEAYLGHRWIMFDPTKMSPVDQLIRIAMGRDAKDVAFATYFGAASMLSMDPAIVPAPVTFT
ncbi:transglutaminase family protein [soil metagenome]